MREKHHVIVPAAAVWPYLANGYQRSGLSAESVIDGNAWALLTDPERKDLVVLEIDQEQHEQLNRLPRRFGVRFTCNQYLTRIEPMTYEVLEEENGEAVVADAERDVAPGVVRLSDLYSTAQEAALSARAEVQSQIELHKIALANLEHFLRMYL